LRGGECRSWRERRGLASHNQNKTTGKGAVSKRILSKEHQIIVVIPIPLLIEADLLHVIRQPSDLPQAIRFAPQARLRELLVMKASSIPDFRQAQSLMGLVSPPAGNRNHRLARTPDNTPVRGMNTPSTWEKLLVIPSGPTVVSEQDSNISPCCLSFRWFADERCLSTQVSPGWSWIHSDAISINFGA
jgi:hypothetical protein